MSSPRPKRQRLMIGATVAAVVLALLAASIPVRCTLSTQVQPAWNTVDPEEKYALWFAIGDDRTADVSAILARRPHLIHARLGPIEATPLEVAILGKHSRILEIVLAAGADPNGLLSDDMAPVCMAVLGKWADGVRILLEQGAKLDVGCGDFSVIERIRDDPEFLATLGIDPESLISERAPGQTQPADL